MTRLIFILITLTTILNGSYFWLSRVGLINNANFEVLIDKNIDFNQRSMVYLNQPEAITAEIEASFKAEHLRYKKALYDHLYDNSALSLFLKSLKYLLYLIFLALIFYNARQSGKPYKLNVVSTIFGIFLLGYSSLSFINFGLAGVIAGFNSFVFLTCMVFSGNILKQQDLDFFALLLLATLGFLLVIAPIEMSKGIQVFNTNSFFKKRMTGFMDQPNTLGIYVVCIFSFFVVQFRSKLGKTRFIMLTLCTLILIVLSGSNTAAAVLCIVLLAESMLRNNLTISRPGHWVLLLLIVVILSLYFTQGRPVIDSLAGRIEKYNYYFSLDLPALKLLFGQGLGAGSNTLLQIQSLFPFEQFADLPIKFSVDSTPLLLIIQTGIIGCVVLYCLMFTAFIKDKHRRPAYLAFFLCGMTINIIEVFPLNIVLALLLSTGLVAKAQKDTP